MPANDEGLPQAAAAAINLTGLRQGCDGGYWHDVSVHPGTQSESRLFMFYSAEVRKRFSADGSSSSFCFSRVMVRWRSPF